ncbi:MAG: EamA family transporter RarD [Gemmataceae bacterium]
MQRPAADSRSGWLYGVAAYGFWGVVPLYFRALRHVGPLELLSQRVVWSMVLLAGLLTILGRWGDFRRCLAEPRTRRSLLLTTILIAVNWYCYIEATALQRVVEASLGYFMSPLASAGLGMLFLGERMRRLQLAALVLATVGVAILAVLGGRVPWLALALVGSFSLYGLFRKTVAADALTGLAAESFLLAPLALGYIAWLQVEGKSAFGTDLGTDLLLMAGSVVTVVPLFCFAQAARRLRLTTLGFLQYLSPTGQLLLAVLALGEPFDRDRLLGFAFIWAALAVYSADAVLGYRRPPLPRLETKSGGIEKSDPADNE